MAKKNSEAKEKPTAAVEVKEPATETAQTAVEVAPAHEEGGSGANTPNTPRPHEVIEARDEYIDELRAEVEKLKEDHAGACANLARIHAHAVGHIGGPSRGVVEDVEDVINGLRARVAELEAGNVQHAGSAPAATEPDHKALAAQAYDLFRKSQAEGDFPAWAELPEQTQKLWRDSYQHVAGGGEPRTDYEQAVKYLIASAQ
jgi:hypothetical protein